MGRQKLSPEEWFERRKESQKRANKRYYEKNKDRIRQKNHNYYLEHRDAISRIQQERYEAARDGLNPEGPMTVKAMEQQLDEKKTKKNEFKEWYEKRRAEMDKKWTEEHKPAPKDDAWEALYGDSSKPQ